MAVSRTLKQIQAQIKVAALGGEEGMDLVNNDTMETILEKGKSYSQTITVSKEATKDQINGFLNAVLSLCAGPFELAEAADLQGTPVITKKIVSQYTLVSEL